MPAGQDVHPTLYQREPGRDYYRPESEGKTFSIAGRAAVVRYGRVGGSAKGVTVASPEASLSLSSPATAVTR